jgi:hypothetical protein
MAKKKMCPISKKICTDCTVYLGRHYYTCMTPDSLSKEVVEELNNRKKLYWKSKDDGKLGFTDFDEVPKTGSWYHNIEDDYLKGEG